MQVFCVTCLFFFFLCSFNSERKKIDHSLCWELVITEETQNLRGAPCCFNQHQGLLRNAAAANNNSSLLITRNYDLISPQITKDAGKQLIRVQVMKISFPSQFVGIAELKQWLNINWTESKFGRFFFGPDHLCEWGFYFAALPAVTITLLSLACFICFGWCWLKPSGRWHFHMLVFRSGWVKLLSAATSMYKRAAFRKVMP